MIRRLLLIAFAMLLPAISLLWLSSGTRFIAIDVPIGHRRIAVAADRGEGLLAFTGVLSNGPRGIRYLWVKRTGESVLDEMKWAFAGFGAMHDAFGDNVVCFPLWLPLLLCAAVLALLMPWRRTKAGRCARCGYDLRASSGRCPECGTPIQSKALA